MPDDTRPDYDDAAWDALLHQLRQPGQQPPPFFYARVQQRLLARTQRGALLPAWLRRPAYAVVLAALVLAVSGDRATAAPGGPARLPLLHHGR